MKKSPSKKVNLQWCTECQQAKPATNPGAVCQWRCADCQELYHASLVPRDITTMTRAEIEQSLRNLFDLRYDRWTTYYEQRRCSLCQYDPKLEMSDFERLLRDEWNRSGGCPPDWNELEETACRTAARESIGSTFREFCPIATG